MAINETIVTGRKFRKCIDVANKLWQRISFWTKACDVEFDDGKTAEEKLGAISGITSDLESTDETLVISAKAANQLNLKVMNLDETVNSKANTSSLGTQCTFSLSGTTLTITSK